MPKASVHPQGRPKLASARYETRDANAKWIFGIVLFLLVSGISIHFLISWMMNSWLAKTPPETDPWTAGAARHARAAELVRPGYPRLQITPEHDLKEFRIREEQELDAYGWINRTAGVVRLPIERAMDLALQRGFPARQGTNPPARGPSSYQLQQQWPATAERHIKGAP